MTDANIKLINRLNWLTVAVVAVLVLFILGGIYAMTTTTPEDVDQRLQRMEKNIGHLEEKLEVRAAEVMAEVQRLRSEAERLIGRINPPPDDAANED